MLPYVMNRGLVVDIEKLPEGLFLDIIKLDSVMKNMSDSEANKNYQLILLTMNILRELILNVFPWAIIDKGE